MKNKNHRYQRWFLKVHELPTYVPGNWLRGSAVTKNCPFSLALTGAELQDSLPLIRYQWLLPVAMNRVFPGWTQDDSYRRRRSGRTERGFVHTVQLGANCLPGTECQAWNETNAAITAE